MSFDVREGSTGAIGTIKVRESGGLSEISEMWVRNGSVDQVFGIFSATVTPKISNGFGYSASFIQIVTSAVTASPVPSDPTGVTILWTTADAGWVATTPTAFHTFFLSPALGPGDSSSATFTGTLTKGSNMATVTVSAYAQNNAPP